MRSLNDGVIFAALVMVVGLIISCAKGVGPSPVKSSPKSLLNITKVDYDDLTIKKERPQVDNSKLATWIISEWKRSKLFRLAHTETESADVGDTHELKVAFLYGFINPDGHAVMTLDKGGLFMCAANISLSIFPAGGAPQVITVTRKKTLPVDVGDTGGEKAQELFRVCVAGVLSEGRLELEQRLQVTRVTDVKLLQLIKASNADDPALPYLVMEAGERRLKSASPALTVLLKSASLDLKLKLSATLGMLGDPTTIPDLAALVSKGDPEVINIALEAIGDIGGPVAIKYLKSIEQTTLFSDVKKKCRDVLNRIH